MPVPKGQRFGGRQKGTPNKRTQEREAAVQEAARKLEALIPNAFEGDSHAFLVSVYKDPTHPIERRLDAAKAALPFERPRLAVTEHSGNLSITHEEALKELNAAMNENLIKLQATPIEAATSGEPSKTHH
jgi:hypothetical protein